MTIRTAGLLDRIPDHLWTQPVSPIRFAVHLHTESVNNVTGRVTLDKETILHAVVTGTGRRALRLARDKKNGYGAIEYSGRVGAQESDKIQRIVLDGRSTKGYWLDVNLGQAHDGLQRGDIVSLYDEETEVEDDDGMRGETILCCVYEITGDKKLRVVAMAGEASIKEFAARPASNLRLLSLSSITFESAGSRNRKKITLRSAHVVSMASFSSRMLGAEQSKDIDIMDRQRRNGFVTEVSDVLREWFMSIEKKDKVAPVCDWSQAFVLTSRVPPQITMQNKSNRTQVQRFVFVPHVYGGVLSRNVQITSAKTEKMYNDAVLRNLELISSVLRPSKFSDPRRHVPLPPRYDLTSSMGKMRKRKYRSVLDICSDMHGHASKVETVMQPPAGRLFGIISLKDIVAENLRGQLLMYDEEGEDSSPWEAKLSFYIQHSRNLPTFDKGTRKEFEKSAVDESEYTKTYRDAFLYPRIEKIDPRVQSVGSESAQKRFGMAKQLFGSLNKLGKVDSQTRKNRRGKKKKADEEELSQNAARQTANFMQELATDQWSSSMGTGFAWNIPKAPGQPPEADLAPQFGPDFVTWTIGDGTFKVGETALKLYVRDIREPGDDGLLQKFPKSEHHAIVKRCFLRVELKCRQLFDRSKVYVLGSAQIPMSRFLHDRWVGFNLDQGVHRDFASMASEDPDTNIWESFNSLSAMKKQLYLGAKSKKDFESGYVKKRRKEKVAAAAKGGTWKTDVERTREVLKEFLYDPTRSTLTVLGSKKLVKKVSEMAEQTMQCNLSREGEQADGVYCLVIRKELEEVIQHFPRPDHRDEKGNLKTGVPNYGILNPDLDDVAWQSNHFLKRPDALRAEAKEMSSSSELGVKSAREESLEEALKMALSHIKIHFQANLQLVDTIAITYPKKIDDGDMALLSNQSKLTGMAENRKVRKILRAANSINTINRQRRFSLLAAKKKEPMTEAGSAHSMQKAASAATLSTTPTTFTSFRPGKHQSAGAGADASAKKDSTTVAARTSAQHLGPLTADTGDGQRIKIVKFDAHPIHGKFELSKKKKESRKKKSAVRSARSVSASDDINNTNGEFTDSDAKLVTDFGLATGDEILLIREGGTENNGSKNTACINILTESVQVHQFQEGIKGPYRPSTVVKSHFRTLDAWQNLIAKTNEKSMQKSIACTATPLMLIAPVCEMCLELRGKSAQSRDDIRLAIMDGARTASRRCLFSSQKPSFKRSSLKFKRKGTILRVNEDKTANILFSELHGMDISNEFSISSRTHRSAATRMHIPCKYIDLVDAAAGDKSSSKRKSKKKRKLQHGDAVKAPFSALITDGNSTIGFLCDVCYEAYQDMNASAWVELSPPSESRVSALVDLELNNMWEIECEKGQDPSIVWEKLSFGLEPFKRVCSVSRADFQGGSNIAVSSKLRKMYAGASLGGTMFKPKHVRLLFCRRSWKRERLGLRTQRIFTGHELLFNASAFDKVISADTTALCTLARRAGAVSRGRHPVLDPGDLDYETQMQKLPQARGFCDTCAYFEARIAHFIVEYEAKTNGGAFDLRSSLRYFLGPVAAVMSFALSMQENHAAEMTAISQFLGGREPDTEDRCIFWAFLNDFVIYHALQFFGEVARVPCEEIKEVRRFAHAGVGIHNSSGPQTILIGGAGEKFNPVRSKGDNFMFNPRSKIIDLRQSDRVDDLVNVAVYDHVKRKWTVPTIKTSKKAEQNFVRMDHSAVSWADRYIIIFGGHVGATRGKAGKIVPGRALCDLHILDTEKWSWEVIGDGDDTAPQLGRYGHSAVITSLVISETEQDVMLVFGGFTPLIGKKQSRGSGVSGINLTGGSDDSTEKNMPNKFVADEKGLDDETYMVLNLSSKNNISWIGPETTRLGRREWSTREAAFGNSKVRFCSASGGRNVQPIPFAYSYCVQIPGDLGLLGDGMVTNQQDLPARVLVFGGQILSSKEKKGGNSRGRAKHMQNSTTTMEACSTAWELKYVIEETQLQMENFGAMSHVKAGLISQRQQGSSAYAKVSLQWQKKMCTGTPPPTGGFARGVCFLNDTVYAIGPKTIYAGTWRGREDGPHGDSWNWERLPSHDSPKRPVFDSTVTTLSSFRILFCGGYSPFADISHGTGLEHILKENNESDGAKILFSPEIITFEKYRIEALVYEGYTDETELHVNEMHGRSEGKVLDEDIELLKLQRLERRTRRLDHRCLEKKSQMRFSHEYDGFWWVQNFGVGENPEMQVFRKRLLGQEALFKSMYKSLDELRIEFEQENLISLTDEEQEIRAHAATRAEMEYDEAAAYFNIHQENPAQFLEPDTYFVQMLDEVFDPYRTGHVNVVGMMRVCNKIGLVRQLVRIRLRLQYSRRQNIKEVDNASRHRFLTGASKLKEMNRFLDVTPLVFYCQRWFDEYANESNSELASAGTPESWVKFEVPKMSDGSISIKINGGLLACCEAYMMVVTIGETIARPPQSILNWAVKVALSHDTVQDDHFSSCIRESAADFICCMCKAEGKLTSDATMSVLSSFENLASRWLAGHKLSRSDEFVLIKITSAVHDLCHVHKLRDYLVSRGLIPIIVLALSTTMEQAEERTVTGAVDSENALQLRLSLISLFTVIVALEGSHITSGNDALLPMITKSIKLLMSAHSAQSRTEVQLFERSLEEGIMPNALDTSDAMWAKLSVSAPYLRKFDNKRQAAMSFVQLCEEKLKDHSSQYKDAKKKFRILLRSSVKDSQSRIPGARDQVSRCKVAYDSAMKTLQKMKLDAGKVLLIMKDLDEMFAKHIRIEMARTENMFASHSFTNKKAFVLQRNHLALTAHSYLKRLILTTKTDISGPRKSTLAAETLAHEHATRDRRNETGISSDTRAKRGFVNMLLEALESINMTDLKTQVLVQWRLLRILSYCGAAAILEEDMRDLTKNNMEQDEREKAIFEAKLHQSLDASLSATTLGTDAEDHGSLTGHPDHRTFAFTWPMGVSMYACELFNVHGFVTLTNILSCCSRIRKLEEVMPVPWNAHNDSAAMEWAERPDEIYFSQNNFSVERYVTLSLLSFLRWLVCRLRIAKNMRQFIRHTAREINARRSARADFLGYSRTQKSRNATENINALIILCEVGPEDACGHGDVIADLADRILDGRIHRLVSLPEYDLDEIMDHMEEVALGQANLDFNKWKVEKEQSEMADLSGANKKSAEVPWWQHSSTSSEGIIVTPVDVNPFDRKTTAHAAKKAAKDGTASLSAARFSRASDSAVSGVGGQPKPSRESCGLSCIVS